jgi:hypothetical protein
MARRFGKLFLICALTISVSYAQTRRDPWYFHPSGLPGTISDVVVHVSTEPKPLPKDFVSPDVDLTLMAGWALRHLSLNPRPALNYEPVFFIRPMHVPPTPEGHDPIVPGDTDCRMDWEFMYMRRICGSNYGALVQKGLRARVLGYLGEDGLAWVPPGHYMEGEVYQGTKVGPEKVASTWATAKILLSLSETYGSTQDEPTRCTARKVFLGLKGLAEWDSGRAYYPGGSGAWRDGKWVKPQVPTVAVEPLVRYWEASHDEEALPFARAVCDGLLADAELLPKQGARILPTGEFHGHMHSTLHGVWGVAHLGAVTGDLHYVEWSKRVYDYSSQFATGTGWVSAALGNDSVRNLSETCATSDMISIASWLAKAGFPEYWDHVERALRNYIRPFQFFATPEYEAIYRKLNKDKSEEQVRSGLARMRELQGGFWGGPAPNDGINWVASPQQCGPYQTPYGCAGMFGCCQAEGMRGLYTVWSNIVTANKDGVFVNLSLNRDSDWAKVIASLPERGRIDVVVKKPGDFFLRPPAWAPRSLVRVARSGREVAPKWGGPALAYLIVKNAKPGEVLTLVYPLVAWIQTVSIWPSKPDLNLTIRWNGNVVADMEPKGKGLPINFSSMPPVPPLPGK